MTPGRHDRVTSIAKRRLTMGAMSPIRPNVIWAMDFQFDTTADGREHGDIYW
jgi:putative transposase